jgi:hypothetical protein
MKAMAGSYSLGNREARARARLLANFEDPPESIFYSRQLEVIYEDEYFY